MGKVKPDYIKKLRESLLTVFPRGSIQILKTTREWFMLLPMSAPQELGTESHAM